MAFAIIVLICGAAALLTGGSINNLKTSGSGTPGWSWLL